MELRQEPSPFFCPLCVCNFFHFHRIFCFGSNKHHSPRHVALRLRLFPLLVVDIFPESESDPFLDLSSPAVQGDSMARYNYAPVMSNPVLVWEVFLSLNGCQTQPHLNPVCRFCGVCLAELWLKFDRAFHCQLFEKLGGLCLAYNLLLSFAGWGFAKLQTHNNVQPQTFFRKKWDPFFNG